MPIYGNSSILNELREADLKGRCGECEFESMCKGCRARALVTTGDQMEEDSRNLSYHGVKTQRKDWAKYLPLEKVW